jgi:hypothetical protein
VLRDSLRSRAIPFCRLLDRLAVNEVLTPYPTDRLHNHHPPPPASCQSRQSNKIENRGVNFGRRSPLQAVTFPPRITMPAPPMAKAVTTMSKACMTVIASSEALSEVEGLAGRSEPDGEALYLVVLTIFDLRLGATLGRQIGGQRFVLPADNSTFVVGSPRQSTPDPKRVLARADSAVRRAPPGRDLKSAWCRSGG